MTRPLRIALFLLSLLAFNSLWALVGGQYHLDLMFWPWKLGLTLAAAGFTLMLATADGTRTWVAAALLLAVLIAAGCVTWYAHLNEPADEDDAGDQLSLYRPR